MHRRLFVLVICGTVVGVMARSFGAEPPVRMRAAPRVTSLFDEGWKFHLSDAPGAQEPGFQDGTWRALDLPHDWSIELPFDAQYASGTGYLPGGIGWYRKSFRLPSSAAGQRVTIHFDGVYMNSEVWINGHALGKRVGCQYYPSTSIVTALSCIMSGRKRLPATPSPGSLCGL